MNLTKKQVETQIANYFLATDDCNLLIKEKQSIEDYKAEKSKATVDLGLFLSALKEGVKK